jgi:hypothetical protein
LNAVRRAVDVCELVGVHLTHLHASDGTRLRSPRRALRTR